MQELLELIAQEKKVFEAREHFYSQAETKEKCVHRLHWQSRQQPTLHQLYELERKIEQRVEELYNQSRDNPGNIKRLLDIYEARLKSVISYINKEKLHWQRISKNIQKELDDNINEYIQQLRHLEIRRLACREPILST